MESSPAGSADEEDELSLIPARQQQQQRERVTVLDTRYASQSNVPTRVLCEASQSIFRPVEQVLDSKQYVKWSRKNRLTSPSPVLSKAITPTPRGLAEKQKLEIANGTQRDGRRVTPSSPRNQSNEASLERSSSPDVTNSSSTLPLKKFDARVHGKSLKERPLVIEGTGPQEYHDVTQVSPPMVLAANMIRSPSVEIQHEQPLRVNRLRRPGAHRQNLPASVSSATGTRRFAINYIAINEHIMREEDMVLVLGESQQSLHLEQSNKSVANAVIRLSKIQKVTMAATSFSMRLETSRTATSPGFESNKIDMRLCTKNDFDRLYKYLDKLDCVPPTQKLEETLEKMFNKREKDQQQHQADRQINSQLHHPDVRLILEQKRRRESISIDDSEAAVQKPPRKKVISQLQVEKRRPQTTESLQKPKEGSDTHIPDYGTKPSVKNHLNLHEPPEGPPGQVKDSNALANTRATRRTRRTPMEMFVDSNLPKFSVEHGLGKPWKRPLVYPKTGKKRVTVEFDDLIRLDEGECLNDSLVEFYLRTLSIELETKSPQIASRVYWFNTYFFDSLTKKAKGRNGVDFDAVRRWTRSIDLFSYDYVVVPINESFHWYVAIICNLPTLLDKVQTTKEQLAEEDSFLSTVTDADPSLQLLSNSSQTVASPADEPGTRQSFSQLHIEDQGRDQSPDGSASKGPTDIARDMQEPEESSSKANGCTEVAADDVDRSEKDEESHSSHKLPDQDKISSIKDVANKPEVHETLSERKPRANQRKKKVAPVRTYDPLEPAIITLDSLDAPHGATVRTLKTYLELEAKDKRDDLDFEGSQLKGITAKGIPQQENFTDCGLYLLGYMEKFVRGPYGFVASLLQKSLNAQNDWPALVPSEMRHQLRNQLFELHREQECERAKDRSDTKKTLEEAHVPDQSTLPEKSTLPDQSTLPEKSTVPEKAEIPTKEPVSELPRAPVEDPRIIVPDSQEEEEIDTIPTVVVEETDGHTEADIHSIPVALEI